MNEARQRGQELRRGLAYALPALLWTLAFFLAPFLVTLAWSLFRRVGTAIDPTPGLDNYARFFGEASLRQALWNSLEISAVVTAVSVALAYPLAYVLAYRVPPRWQRVALVLTVLPFWTSYVVRSYAWLVVLAPSGVVNRTLIALGLTAEPLQIAYTPFATVLGFVHFFTMLAALTLYANLVRINPRLRLAAQDLGASRLQTFLKVTLPLSLPGLATGAFLTFVLTIGDYVTPQILGGNTSLVLPQAILFQMGRRGDVPMAAAMSLVLMVVVGLAYAVSARAMRSRSL